ncbi:MAG: sialate O-acetylesterase, partial [Muribaculaceae bacterium]|nr:sialate O-acetylesterase [Muribaculaceae bacterium]
VIQQNSNVKLWGQAKPDKKVTVKTSWSKEKSETRSDSKGNWSISVQTPSASYEPLSITISDGEPLTISNILAGDVWICSGQSNMEMPMHGNNSQTIEGNLEHIMKGSSLADRLRFFTVERTRSYDKELTDCGGTWEIASPESVSDFSAVGYFFGLTLNEAENIPIGLIATNWGDTKVEAWMPREELHKCVSPELFEIKHSNHWCKPSEMYGSMIAPIRKFKAKGFIWYQGESNRKDADHYEIMLNQLVNRWRRDWGDNNNEMPFYFVQIAPYIYDGSNKTSYPLFVEAQTRAADLIPNCEMATTTDIGEEYSIHPGKKKEVGERLAALALSKTYGLKGFEPIAPRLKSFEVKDDKIILKMEQWGGGWEGAGEPGGVGGVFFG